MDVHANRSVLNGVISKSKPVTGVDVVVVVVDVVVVVPVHDVQSAYVTIGVTTS